ncbi:MAG: carotenoid oxygenase family protein, partial [Cyanobacteriota bacterium]|nr:carotenoid oxygenase family protein [Cyanobacteriota bacterium]
GQPADPGRRGGRLGLGAARGASRRAGHVRAGSVVFSVNHSKSLKTMLAPIFKSEDLDRDTSELIEIARDYLQTLKRLLTDLNCAIGLALKWKKKVPILKIFDKIFRTATTIPLLLQSPEPAEFKQFARGFKQPLIDEIHDLDSLDGLREDIQSLLQLINLGLRFLKNAGNLQDITYVIRWDGKGDLERWKLVNTDGTPVTIQQTTHQIGVTEDYVVLMDTSLKIGLAQLIALKNEKLDRFVREKLDYPQLPDSSIYLVPRSELKDGEKPIGNDPSQTKEVTVKKLSIPREGFHFHVNYTNPDDKITLHAIHACAWDVAEWLRKADLPLTDNPRPPVGMMVDGMDINQMGRYEIDCRTGALISSELIYSDSTWATGLYAHSKVKHDDEWLPPEIFDNIYLHSYGAWGDLLSDFISDLYKNYKYREIPAETVREISKSGKPSHFCRLDTQKMELLDNYQFPEGYFANSPQFVPRADGSGGSKDGYIVCTVNYNPDPCNRLKTSQSEIWIFDGNNLQGGPLCKMRHPLFNVGFSTHTIWLPKIARRNSSYCIPVREDFQGRVEQAAPELPEVQKRLEQLFENEVYPHFPCN